MIALVTVAVFIYRKPFAHLFSAVGYGTLGSSERAEVSLRDAGFTFRRNTLAAATVAIPGVAGSRAARWARRNPAQAAAVAGGLAVGAGAAATAAAARPPGTVSGTSTGTGQAAAADAYASRLRPDPPPAADGDGEPASASRRAATAASLARPKNLPETDGGTGRTPPPLDLPPRNATSGGGPASAATTWSREAGRSPAPGPAPSRSRATPGGSPGSRSAQSARPANGTGGTSGSGGSARSGGSGARQPAPAWSLSGWAGASTAAGPRQRPPGERRPAEPPADPPRSPGNGTGDGTGHGTEEPRAMPFWLRPVRRK